jgi:hypothetical protein
MAGQNEERHRVRRHGKEPSAGSNHGTGGVRGLFGGALATRGASSGSKGGGARQTKLIGLLAICSAFLAFATASASARTTNQYLSQIDRSTAPTGTEILGAVAVSSSGDVYATTGREGIERYDSSGAYLGQINGTATPRGAMSSNYVAVASNGDLYVSDAEGGVVDRFNAAGIYLSQLDGSNTPQGSFTPNLLAAGAGGDVYVVDESNGVIDEFDNSGALITQFEGSATPQGSFCAIRGLAVSADGHVYAGDVCNGVIDEFDASGAYLGQFDGSGTPQGFLSPGGATVGADGNLYVGDVGNAVIDEFDASGTYLGQFDGATTPRGSFSPGGEALPVTAAPGGSLYVADAGAPVIDRFSETRVVVPDATTEPASALDQTVATLNGTVNPDGAQLTDCHFEVVPASQFEADGYGSVTPTELAPCVPSAAAIAADANDHAVTAEWTGLLPNTTYHFRLLAGNANGTTHALDETFITLAPPSLSGEAAANNTPTEVDLNATINPNGTETFYRFEYGLSTAYGTVLPEPDASIGAERSDQVASVHIAGLLPETTYHYRVIAHSTVGTTESGDLTFRTAGGLFPLPDNRAWEQVTPVDKHGVNVTAIEYVAEDGNAVGFDVLASLAGSETLRGFNSYLARRTATGWVTSPLTLPSRLAPANGPPSSTALTLSSNLTRALLIGGVPSPGASPISIGSGSGANRFFLETLPADPTAPPTYSQAGPDLVPLGGSPDFFYWGGAPDLSSLVFASTAQLTSDPVGADSTDTGLYEISETGRGANAPLRRVDVDNSGAAISLGVRLPRMDGFNAVSNDGSRVFFDDDNGRVYARTDASTTTAISDPSASECQPSCVDPAFQSAEFAGASEDGTEAYFTTKQELVPGDTDTSADLYEYDFSAPAGHHLVQISAGGGGDATPGSGADVVSMVRLSDDGSRAAFIAHGVLTTEPNASGAHAVAGADNFYDVDVQPGGGTITKFVGVLLDSDSALWDVATTSDAHRPAQASSPDGRFLVFATHAQLTPDDTDAATDVYRYDDQTGELSRVSHAADGDVQDGNGTGDATITAPDFTAEGGAIGPRSQAGRQRAISDDGSTIVFGTDESLQQVDQNGKQNVYEWHDGTVSLIGDPQDPAGITGNLSRGGIGVLSRSGRDLFTMSSSALVPQDTDGSVRDVYDARIGGGFPYTPPSVCNALADGCQPPSSLPPSPSPSATARPNPKGNSNPPALSFGKIGSAARKALARTGRLTLKVSGPAGSTVRAKATAEIDGKTVLIGSATRRITAGGTGAIQLRISKAARRQLAAAGKLVVRVAVTDSRLGGSRSTTLKLTAVRPPGQNKGGRS